MQIKTVHIAQPVFIVLINQKQIQDFQRQLPTKLTTSVISPLPLSELSLHASQTDFPSLSESISFHDKNQFSVTLSSTVKVNSPHTDIHIQISPSVTQHYLVHAPSASIHPTQHQFNPESSLYELIWFTHSKTTLIPTHTRWINFLIPAEIHFPSLLISFLPQWRSKVFLPQPVPFRRSGLQLTDPF